MDHFFSLNYAHNKATWEMAIESESPFHFLSESASWFLVMGPHSDAHVKSLTQSNWSLSSILRGSAIGDQFYHLW